jgi:hypothetical protein
MHPPKIGTLDGRIEINPDTVDTSIRRINAAALDATEKYRPEPTLEAQARRTAAKRPTDRRTRAKRLRQAQKASRKRNR